MVARTVKIMGSAYSTSGNVSITVNYNGSRVFTGNVPTTTVPILPLNQPNTIPKWEQELGLFETNTDTTGTIPVKITVSGGRLFYGHFWMNYIGPGYEVEQTDPNIPIDPNDPSTYTLVKVVDTESNFGDPNFNTIESDGLTNTRLNGQVWDWRLNVGVDQLGDWAYTLSSGDVFEFDFFVDPNKIKLTND
jgi:hypothetical protein